MFYVDQKLHKVAINVGLSKKVYTVYTAVGNNAYVDEFYQLCRNPDDEE